MGEPVDDNVIYINDWRIRKALRYVLNQWKQPGEKYPKVIVVKSNSVETIKNLIKFGYRAEIGANGTTILTWNGE